MESPNPKFALYGATNECARTNTFLLPLSEVSTGAVSLYINLLSKCNSTFIKMIGLYLCDSFFQIFFFLDQGPVCIALEGGKKCGVNFSHLALIFSDAIIMTFSKCQHAKMPT